jgi:hypothetical protein
VNAPLECGIWRATLQRCNDRGQPLLGADSGRTITPSNRSQWPNTAHTPADTAADGYRPSSPRGPPPFTVLV